jgi:magnesium transporter
MNNSTPSEFNKNTQIGMFFYFSQLMDRPVFDKDGVRVGEVYDIAVQSKEVYPLSSKLVIRKGLVNRSYAGIIWQDVDSVSSKKISLKISAAQIVFSEVRDNKEELTLRRDILDQQVVDTYNHKVIRINDIHMLPVDNALMIAHVDISVRGLLRRLGYEKLVDFFLRLVNPKAAYLSAENLIAWKYIQPLSINPVSMTIKVDIPQKKFSTIPAADFGEIFQDLSIQHQRILFKSLDISLQVKIFSNIDFKHQKSLIEDLDDKQTVDLLSAMPSDEATDFLEKLPNDITKEFLSLMESKQAKKFSELLGYSSDSAGGLMTKDFMAFVKGTTVETVIKMIKERSFKVEPIQFVYIIDENNHFIGAANYRQLMIANLQDPVEKAAYAKSYYVKLDSSVKEVAYLMEKYKYFSMAVVDENGILQGVITVDDILSQLIAIAWRRMKKIKALSRMKPSLQPPIPTEAQPPAQGQP